MTPSQKKILNFIKEIDSFKKVYRQIYIGGGKRLENNAEHTWHLCMIVWLYSSSYEKKINLEKALKLALVHDLVEIYAGDTFSFDFKARVTKKERELKASKKLFKLLPTPQKEELENLWREYEERKTKEAKFVQALDKIHPTIQNIISDGRSWKEHNITAKMIRDYKSIYNKGSKFLESLFEYNLKEGLRKKYLKKS